MTELFGLARSAYVVTPLIGSILALILWSPAASEVVVLWLLGLVAAMGGRVLLHLAYLRSDTRVSMAIVWERRFAIGAAVTGGVWALAPALFFGSGDSLQRVAVMFVLGGMVVGAAGI